MKKNRLSREKSPYLLQHAHNPVDWHPWDDAAFRLAEEQDKPVFLSVGYSTCHWCHVMAHESFEDRQIADLLNEAFVCIKVDREERPDIDKIYMTACQMLTGAGGWPLTIFMTADRRPFYAATYLPKETRYGRMGLLELIPQIKTLWRMKRQEVLNAAGEITSYLVNRSAIAPEGEAGSHDLPQKAYESIRENYDAVHGGFGPPPKFPIPHQLLFLLRYGEGRNDSRARDMAVQTLEAMRRGGVYDHIGFGFHRYSTDRKWLVPHFEKMLYDQALQALAYLEAYQAMGQRSFGDTVREIFTYVLRDMTAPEGGFYSAEDADSEGEEGKFYAWTVEEIRQVLTDEEADFVIRVFGVETAGNFREEATQVKTGRNILHVRESWTQLASEAGFSESTLLDKRDGVRQKLFQSRNKRIHPFKDDKILTDWNGLMIAALARGAQVLDETIYLAKAKAAAHFLLSRLLDKNDRLLHRWRAGDTTGTALLDDYAFLIWGLLECYEASFDPAFLERSLTLQEQLDAHFWDEQEGGYYFTPNDGEQIIVRQKESYDGAIPSGNAVAMLNLIRLGRMTGQPQWENQAESIKRGFMGEISRLPTAHTMFMLGLLWNLQRSYEIVIVGDPGAEDTQRMIRCVRQTYLPNRVLLLKDPTKTFPDMAEMAPFTKDMHRINGRATVYVCTDRACRNPVTDVELLKQMLDDCRRSVPLPSDS